MFKEKTEVINDKSIAIIDLKDEQVARITLFGGSKTDRDVGVIVIRKGKALIPLTIKDYWSDYYVHARDNKEERKNYRCELLPNGFELVVSQPEA